MKTMRRELKNGRRAQTLTRATIFGLALLAAAWAGCSSSSFEGVPVAVTVDSSEMSVSVPTGQWEIEELLLAPTAVEIVPCNDGNAPSSASVAHLKHVESTPFQSGTSLVWPVIGGAATHYGAGTIEPPAGEYCSVRLLIAPLDDDSLRGAQYPELVGHSLSFRGTQTSTTTAAPRSVNTTSTLRVESEVQLDEAPVLIERDATLILSINVGIALANVEPDADTTEIARSILSAIPNAVSARIRATAL